MFILYTYDLFTESLPNCNHKMKMCEARTKTPAEPWQCLQDHTNQENGSHFSHSGPQSSRHVVIAVTHPPPVATSDRREPSFSSLPQIIISKYYHAQKLKDSLDAPFRIPSYSRISVTFMNYPGFRLVSTDVSVVSWISHWATSLGFNHISHSLQWVTEWVSLRMKERKPQTRERTFTTAHVNLWARKT